MTANVVLVTAGGGPTNPVNLSAAVTAGDWIYAQMFAKSGGATPVPQAPTVDGVAMTQVGSEYQNPGSNCRMRLYKYQAPTTTTAAIQGNLDANFYNKALIVAVVQNSTGAATGLLGAASSGANQTWTNVVSATGDLVIGFIDDLDGRTMTPAGGTTSYTGTGCGTANEWVVSKAGASLVTLGGSYPSTTDAQGIAFSVASSSPPIALAGDAIARAFCSLTLSVGSTLALSSQAKAFCSITLGSVTGSLTTGAFKNWSSSAPLTSLTIPNVAVIGTTDRRVDYQTTNMVTDATTGQLIFSNVVGLIPGKSYQVCTWGVDGSVGGNFQYTAS